MERVYDEVMADGAITKKDFEQQVVRVLLGSPHNAFVEREFMEKAVRDYRKHREKGG
jgi:hypothetical protein